jgi:hypothetical protein
MAALSHFHSHRQSRLDFAGPLPFVSPRVWGAGCGGLVAGRPHQQKRTESDKADASPQPNGQIHRPSDYFCFPGKASVARFPRITVMEALGSVDGATAWISQRLRGPFVLPLNGRRNESHVQISNTSPGAHSIRSSAATTRKQVYCPRRTKSRDRRPDSSSEAAPGKGAMLTGSREPLRKSDQTGSSDLQFAKIGNAGLHQFHVHFDEIVL